MKRKLIARPQAEFDIIKHSVYLLEHNPAAAARFESAVREALQKIELEPLGGTRLDHPGDQKAELRFRRPKGFKSHLLIYQVTDDCVFVLRVLHGSQDIEAALRP